MKKLGILLASLFVMTLATQHVKAQSGAAARASANATATIVPVISVEKTEDLNFGTFASGSTPGTISMETNGARNQTGGVVVLDDDASHPATFTAHGPVDGHYFITLPADNSVTLTLSGGTETMTITHFEHSASGNFGTSGQETFNVGGVLNVAAFQRAGTYTGTFDVIVTNQ